MGAIPDGISIVYFRTGIDLLFITSADGILDKSGAGVSLLGRGILIGKMVEELKDKDIYRFGYSEILFLWSTDGKTFEK